MPIPRAVSRAHNGVLFLDELPSSAAMSSRSCDNRLRRGSYTYNLVGVIDFTGMAALIARAHMPHT